MRVCYGFRNIETLRLEECTEYVAGLIGLVCVWSDLVVNKVGLANSLSFARAGFWNFGRLLLETLLGRIHSMYSTYTQVIQVIEYYLLLITIAPNTTESSWRGSKRGSGMNILGAQPSHLSPVI